MATTPSGLPYPVGADKVVDGDDAIRALAAAIDGQILAVLSQGAALVCGTTNIVLPGLTVVLPAGPTALLIEWDVQSLNQNSGATREAIFNVMLDGAYIGNGSRQKTLVNNEYASVSGKSTASGLTVAAHTIELQARASASAAVSLSSGYLVIRSRK